MTQGEELLMLREQVRQLRQNLVSFDCGFPREWGLTVQESRALKALAMKGQAHVGDMIESLWWDRGEPSNPAQQIRVVMLRVRRKLQPYGIEVKSRTTYGYWLEPPARKIVRERLGL